MIGLVGKKVGMTRIFTEDGVSIPVTVIEVEANRVTQVKDLANDGYRAVQVTTGAKKANRVTKPEAGHFAKAGVEAGRGLWEFRLADGEEYTVGQNISVELFADVKKVDVTGTSKGKGFAGTVKRWNFRTQDATHGNLVSPRSGFYRSEPDSGQSVQRQENGRSAGQRTCNRSEPGRSTC